MNRNELKKLIREAVEEVIKEVSGQDPTREELVNFFKGKQGLYGSWDQIESDAEAAIYWFAHDYHGGQTSNLYSVQSTSEYSPGRMMSSAEDEGESVKMMYDDLVTEFANKELEKEQFAPPLGVAETGTLEESGPPNFPKKMREKIIAQYKKKYPDNEARAMKAASKTIWKIFHAKKNGHKKVNEMWTAFEGKNLNEAEEMGDQDEDHDETDLSNPEENKEVELAKKIKALANDILSMHGVEDEKETETETDEIETDDTDMESDEEIDGDEEYSSEEPDAETGEESDEEVTNLQEKWNKKDVIDPRKKGMFKGKTVADLEKELKKLKKKGPHKKGSKEYKKMQELNFAIRAKRHWPKGKR